MIITICGSPGSGKSIVGRTLAKKLKYTFYSAGDVRGKYATEHNLTIDELNKLSQKDPTSDRLVDNYMKKIGKEEDKFVIDGRMGFYCIPNSVKVFIEADFDVRAKRVFESKREDEKYKTLAETKKAIKKRVESDIKRYEHLYHVNPYDLRHYDLVIDATKISIDKAVDKIYNFAKAHHKI